MHSLTGTIIEGAAELSLFRFNEKAVGERSRLLFYCLLPVIDSDRIRNAVDTLFSGSRSAGQNPFCSVPGNLSGPDGLARYHGVA